MTPTAEPILSVRDLVTHFVRRGIFGTVRAGGKVAAVDGVSFDVAEGQTLGIVGESGCGKTTLGRTILGLARATSGSVKYRGQEIVGRSPAGMRPLRREMQMIFQDLDAALNPRMRVEELLAEAITLHRHGLSPGDVRDRSVELLELVKLKPAKLSSLPPELSGGEKRRVSIARVLAVEPKLIVADEPLSALDVSIAAQVTNLLRDLQDRLGLTYLFISHDLRMVELLAGSVIVMYLGKIVEKAPAGVLSRRAAHPYSRLLWSAVDPHGGRRIAAAGDATRWELEGYERIASGCRFRDRCPVYVEKGSPVVCANAASEPVLTQGAGAADSGHLVACHFPAGPQG